MVNVKFSRARISALLTIIALILWSCSIIQARFAIGKYGLISGFPSLYFFSLAVLTLASAILWTSKENHWKLLLLQLSFLVISLFLANLISGGFESNYSWAVGEVGNPEFIIRTGHTNPNFWQLWQSNWPGTDIFQSISLIFTGNSIKNFTSFLPWIPILWESMFFFPLFVLLKNTIGKVNPNYIWAGIWIFYIANWPGLHNNGPQPLGVLLAFSVLATFSSFDIWKENASSLGQRISVTVIFAAVTVSHFLSSLVALAVVISNFISRRLKSYKIPILAALFVILWAILGATVYTTGKIPTMVTEVFKMGEALQRNVGKSIASSASHTAVSMIRLALSGIIVFISILGGVISFRQKQNRYVDISLLCNAVFMGFVAAAVGSGYGSELINRFYIYLLPVLIYFSVKLLQYRQGIILLAIVLIICLPLTFIAQYGNEEMDYLTTGYMNATDFFYIHTDGGWINGYKPIGSSQKAEIYTVLGYDELEVEGNQILVPTREWLTDHNEFFTHYVVISDHDKAYFDYFINQPELMDKLQMGLDNTVHSNLAFSNNAMSLYVSQDPLATP